MTRYHCCRRRRCRLFSSPLCFSLSLASFFGMATEIDYLIRFFLLFLLFIIVDFEFFNIFSSSSFIVFVLSLFLSLSFSLTLFNALSNTTTRKNNNKKLNIYKENRIESSSNILNITESNRNDLCVSVYLKTEITSSSFIDLSLLKPERIFFFIYDNYNY